MREYACDVKHRFRFFSFYSIFSFASESFQREKRDIREQDKNLQNIQLVKLRWPEEFNDYFVVLRSVDLTDHILEFVFNGADPPFECGGTDTILPGELFEVD